MEFSRSRKLDHEICSHSTKFSCRNSVSAHCGNYDHINSATAFTRPDWRLFRLQRWQIRRFRSGTYSLSLLESLLNESRLHKCYLHGRENFHSGASVRPNKLPTREPSWATAESKGKSMESNTTNPQIGNNPQSNAETE